MELLWRQDWCVPECQTFDDMHLLFAVLVISSLILITVALLANIVTYLLPCTALLRVILRVFPSRTQFAEDYTRRLLHRHKFVRPLPVVPASDGGGDDCKNDDVNLGSLPPIPTTQHSNDYLISVNPTFVNANTAANTTKTTVPIGGATKLVKRLVVSFTGSNFVELFQIFDSDIIYPEVKRLVML